ncbi:MAG: glycosyltransferase family 4 protein [Acidilobaceae archaeon]|nr:glycosyltransferase family 4 protein [Acidilobaceae archaeon]MCX8165773.1 glycosyltransferase family 4 protein [Acidilobaceae archaeon]MDW7974198.1 glycosyltransferase family 4 protein [Sulfolobales archaeon]
MLVQHTRWGYGGGVMVFLQMISSLAKAGFKVYAYTLEKPQPKTYEEVMGEPLPENVTLLSSRLSRAKLFTIYKPFLSRLLDGRRKGFDVRVVSDGYFTREEARGVPTIYYVHFPMPLNVEGPWGSASKYNLQPLSRGLGGFVRGVIWWLYGKPYRFLARRAYGEMIESSVKNFVNSRFTLKAYLYALTLYERVDREDLKKKVEVLYPPLPRPKRLLELRRENRVPCVLSLGRFSEEKRYELVLEVARRLKDYRFYIAGGVAGRASMLYYERIARSRPHNVTVAANVSEGLKEALLSRCQVYLHTMVGEHFGIAPLEALAAGATPVVHRFSGTWTDVCDERYCYDFKTTDPEEVAEKVQNALERPRAAPVEHIERFSPELFGRRIVRAVEEALSI